MKRAVSFLSAIIMLFAFASCGQQEISPETYLGEGTKIRFRMLVDANQKLYNDVFVLDRLECDESKAFEKDGERWAPVTDKSYSSYKMLEDHIKEVYTEECAAKLLEDYDFYHEIDGVFCLRLTETPGGGKKWVRDNTAEPRITENKDGSYTAVYRLVCENKSMKEKFTFVRTDSGFRLDELRAAD